MSEFKSHGPFCAYCSVQCLPMFFIGLLLFWMRPKRCWDCGREIERKDG